MNDKILELYNKAGMNKEGVGLDAEMFAELIISECMEVADLPNSVDGKYDNFLPSEMIAKHFGVE